MAKTQISISISLDQLTILCDIQRKYRLKSNGEAVELIINQWQRFIESAAKQIQQQRADEKKHIAKPINPQCLG